MHHIYYCTTFNQTVGMKSYTLFLSLAFLISSCGNKSGNIEMEKDCNDQETVAEINRFRANIYSENGKVYIRSATDASVIFQACNVPLEWLNVAQTEGLVDGLLKAKTPKDKYQKIAVITISWITNP